MNFQHFLITRINVDWHISRPRSRSERNDIDFLNYRLDIFEKTCHPSIQAQTNQAFTWLILLDSETPTIIRERVESYCSKGRIIPVYIDQKDTLLETIKDIIKKSISNPATHLITTNLDSDDAVSKNFIAAIQNEFRSQDFEFINFPFGYLYQVKQQQLFLRNWSTAPCHTLIEQYSNFKTAIQYRHIEIENHPNRQVMTDPLWLMTAHDMNVRTQFDISAAWQRLSRLNDNFCTHIIFPKQTFIQTYKDTFSEVFKVIFSKREWDHPRVRMRKIVAIISPPLLYSASKLQQRFSLPKSTNQQKT